MSPACKQPPKAGRCRQCHPGPESVTPRGSLTAKWFCTGQVAACLAAARSHRPLAASNLTACLGSARPALSRLTGRHCSIAGSQLTRKPDMLTRENRPKHLKAAALHGGVQDGMTGRGQPRWVERLSLKAACRLVGLVIGADAAAWSR